MNTFGIVGMGSIGQRHLRNLRYKHPSSKIFCVSSSGSNTSLYDQSDGILNLEELIYQNPDYIIVANPSSFHVEVAKEIINHNIPVLIEKPLANNFESCLDIEAYCTQKKDPKVAVGYCLRFLPSAKIVKQVIDEGVLGEIYNVNAIVGQFLPTWRKGIDYKKTVSARKSLGGGVLLELSHELDYLQWYLGDLNLQHSFLRTTDELGIKVEDIANLILTSKNNVYVSVHLDFIQKFTKRTCIFIGEKGLLEWNLMKNIVTLSTASGKKTLYENEGYDKNNMYLEMLAEFEKYIKNDKNSLASLNSSSNLVKIIDEAKNKNSWSLS